MGGGGGGLNPMSLFGGGSSGKGGLLGGPMEMVFGSSEPMQTPQQFQLFDPMTGLKPQQAFLESTIRGQMGGGGGAGTISAGPNPFVAPGPQQTAALGALENWYQQATPAFGAGVRGLEDVVGGKYLDVANVPAFQRLSQTRQDVARDLFSDALSRVNSEAARTGTFSSSARQRQAAEQARRVGTEAAADIERAGFGQYGAERGLQDAAMARALGVAPGLAQQVFAGGEQIRGAEQAANVAHMNAQIEAQRGTIEAALRARGLDQAGINQYMNFLKLSALDRINAIQGKSPQEQNVSNIGTLAKAASSVYGMI